MAGDGMTYRFDVALYRTVAGAEARDDGGLVCAGAFTIPMEEMDGMRRFVGPFVQHKIHDIEKFLETGLTPEDVARKAKETI